MIFFDLGVYNSTEEFFFDKLIKNKIDVFCDIRQRRGVRGAKYSFVNKKRLESKLEEYGIIYKHNINLAPTKEIRELQKRDDLIKNNMKKERKRLGEIFVNKFQDDIINDFDFQGFISDMEKLKAQRVALFCVEEFSEACHRSLVSKELNKMGYKTVSI
ncbi:DUF488 domain-containing protein [Tenacibaculum mesophilum]|uniref:DUF488 domain-containing protein n=1 Tax=Tenacibaculum mesophilum TaxID=104268 RepID=A0AAE9SEW3_9FLAO|nr:DUF488 domain-containing protein [Tenacibaculum mesophilum]UTD15405.1 DUF488 domain-containing protein [Tenacibaculum mesophilum]